MESVVIPAWVLFGVMPLGVLGLLNLSGLFLWAYHLANLDTLRTTLWAEGLPRPIFTLAVLFWLTLFGLLFISLCSIIIKITWGALDTTNQAQVWDFRFLIAQLAGVTAVFGAVVAFPFTVIRLRITAEQNRHAEDSLFNEKMNAAIADLHAQRQVTIKEDGQALNAWEDDVVRRSGAIDRLEALVEERPKMAQRVAHMLSTYVKEQSDDRFKGSRADQKFSPNRSDIRSAVHALSRLPEISGISGKRLIRDLTGTNLFGLSLSGSDFENADFSFALMERVDFTRSNLAHAKFTDARLNNAVFFDANLTSASFRGSDLSEAGFRYAILNGADFGNSSAREADFSFTELRGAEMSHAELRSTTFDHSDIVQANFYEADLAGASFSSATIERSDFSAAYFMDTQLNAETLHECEVGGSQDNEAISFGGASLSGTLLYSIDLSQSDLVQNQLESALGCRDISLPENTDYPKHWLDSYIEFDEMIYEWTLYKSNPAAYVPPQDRDKV